MTRFEKYLVWSSTAAVSATGGVYAWMKYLMTPTDEWAVINHPLQPLVLKLHILTAPFLVFAVGVILMRHIWPHFRAGIRLARRSGVTTALVTVPMILTGYAIQAVTHAGWLRGLGWAHLGLGVVFALGSIAHAVAGRRLRRVSAQRSGPRRAQPHSDRKPTRIAS